MSQAYLHGFGSGSGVLNYSVAAFSAETELPETAAENTIAVITDAAVSGWQFSSGAPENPQEGMVWILTGTGSAVAFSAVSAYPVMIYPLEAMQYVGGVWVSRTAKSYINGVWQSWFLYLYAPGDACTDVTGGWVGKAVGIGNNDNETKKEPVITSGAESMLITHESGFYSGMAVTANKVDLTEFAKLTFAGTVQRESSGTQWCIFGIWSEIATGDYLTNLADCVAFGTGSETGVWSLDVSALTGSYYVGFGMVSTSGKTDSITVEKLYLER